MDIKESYSVGNADILKIIFGNKCVTKVLSSGELEFTLAEVREIAVKNGYSRGVIILIAESPLEGEVFEYGNYGEFWVEHGKTRGYA